jgi:hypothetical protein
VERPGRPRRIRVIPTRGGLSAAAREPLASAQRYGRFASMRQRPRWSASCEMRSPGHPAQGSLDRAMDLRRGEPAVRRTATSSFAGPISKPPNGPSGPSVSSAGVSTRSPATGPRHAAVYCRGDAVVDLHQTLLGVTGRHRSALGGPASGPISLHPRPWMCDAEACTRRRQVTAVAAARTAFSGGTWSRTRTRYRGLVTEDSRQLLAGIEDLWV